MGIALSTRLRDVLEYAVRGAPQAMQDELQRLLAAPDEVARLRAKLKKYEEDEEWLRECDVYAAFQEEIEETARLRAECDKLDKQAAMAIALADEAQALSAKVLDENDALRRALKAAPKPPWNFRPTIGWQGDYCDWYEAQVTLWKGLQ